MKSLSAVLDASAVLAYLQGENGAQTVKELLLGGGTAISSVNWSEVAQKVTARGSDWATAAALLGSYGIEVLDATRADAELAASNWQESPALSLAERFCLATASRRGVPAWTAETAWGESDEVRQIRSHADSTG